MSKVRAPTSVIRHLSSVFRHVIGAVVRLEIIADGARVRLADRRAESIDHHGDLRVPHRRGEERRVHLDVVEAVAGAAVGLDQIEPGALLERDGLLLRGGGGGHESGRPADRERWHAHLPYAATTVTECMTLW